MSLTVSPGVLLLEEVKEAGSEFALSNVTPNKYKVAYGAGEYQPGVFVYLLDIKGYIKIDGTEYTVADESEVIAHVA